MPQIQVLTPAEIDAARESGKILRACLEEVARHVKAGVTTRELDAIAEEFIRSRGGEPVFKGYHGYPASLCTSINDVCVHGIPGDQTLKDGDIIALDCGVTYRGICTDACVSVAVGDIPESVRTFLSVTKQALDAAVKIVRAGVRVGDISQTVQTVVEAAGYRCVPALTGHGLGASLHQYPDIPNVGKAGTGAVIPAGALIAIEPITSMGTDHIKEDEDGWTIRTRDGSLSGHFEHTLLVTEKGCEVIA